MSDIRFHIVVSGIESEEAAEALAVAIAGSGNDDSPSLAIEKVLRHLEEGEFSFADVEVMEYAIEEDDVVGRRYWL